MFVLMIYLILFFTNILISLFYIYILLIISFYLHSKTVTSSFSNKQLLIFRRLDSQQNNHEICILLLNIIFWPPILCIDYLCMILNDFTNGVIFIPMGIISYFRMGLYPIYWSGYYFYLDVNYQLLTNGILSYLLTRQFLFGWD